MVRVAVVGSGYVGLCTGVVLAEAGHDVTLVDSDARKVAAVGEGRAPFYEPGLDEALARLRGRIGGTTALPDAVAAAEFTYLCVGTPQGEDGRIDLAHVRAASADVGRALRRAARGHVVVVKSTVVPGTADGTVAPEVEAASGLREGRDFHVVSNPEFLQEGSALRNARSPDRVVAGGDPAACRRVLDLHKPGCPEVVVDRRTAETIKYAANAFLATKVAFANEMANVCARLGVDWYDVAAAIGHDPRIGPLFLRAGVGFGGSCFPKDLAALARVAQDAGAPSGILGAVRAHNDRQPLEAVRMLEEELGDLRGKTVALLGLAFKADTDDVRETRALPLWRALRERGVLVVCHDPRAGGNFLRLAPEAHVADDLQKALAGADAAVVQTEWPEYAALSPGALRAALRSPVVVDGRRTFDPAEMRAAGLRYRAIGLGR